VNDAMKERKRMENVPGLMAVITALTMKVSLEFRAIKHQIRRRWWRGGGVGRRWECQAGKKKKSKRRGETRKELCSRQSF